MGINTDVYLFLMRCSKKLLTDTILLGILISNLIVAPQHETKMK